MIDTGIWTAEDFNRVDPFEAVYTIEDPFEREQAMTQMRKAAAALGIKNFVTMYKAYVRSVQGQTGQDIVENVTTFPGQPLELDCGPWVADSSGIYQEREFARVYACPHPVMPVERFVNVDTGDERLRLAYQKGKGAWRTIIVEKSVLASASKVTELAARGIAVNSDNAKNFIRYIAEVETLNYDRIPEAKSVGRLGYIHDVGFSPYMDGLQFDGQASFKALFDSVSSHGTFEKWLEAAQWARHSSLTAKIMLAASFASPLLYVLGALPFFVHLWGVDSGTGKTVALMLAASVWGNPQVGAYIKTFQTTTVGTEYTAAFLNHLPLCLDELQLSKDSKGKSNFDVYKLAEGVGKTRGNKFGGVDMTPTWKNTIITTGESPLTGQSAGAGAVNRVIDIECTTDSPAIPGGCGMWLSGKLKENHGFAGRLFVNKLYQQDAAKVKQIYEEYFSCFTKQDTTEKQAMAAAALLTADTLSCLFVYPEGQESPLTVDELSQFLASKSSASAGQRGYDFIVSWIAMNKSRFRYDADATEIWGEIREGGNGEPTICYVVSSKLRQALENEGFSYNPVLSWMRSNGLIPNVDMGKKLVCTIRINSIPTKCVSIKIQ